MDDTVWNLRTKARRLSWPLLRSRYDSDGRRYDAVMDFVPGFRQRNSVLKSLSRVSSISKSFVRSIGAQGLRKQTSMKRCRLEDPSIEEFDFGLEAEQQLGPTMNSRPEHSVVDLDVPGRPTENLEEPSQDSVSMTSRNDQTPFIRLAVSPLPVQHVHTIGRYRMSSMFRDARHRLSVCN